MENAHQNFNNDEDLILRLRKFRIIRGCVGVYPLNRLEDTHFIHFYRRISVWNFIFIRYLTCFKKKKLPKYRLRMNNVRKHLWTSKIPEKFVRVDINMAQGRDSLSCTFYCSEIRLKSSAFETHTKNMTKIRRHSKRTSFPMFHSPHVLTFFRAAPCQHQAHLEATNWLKRRASLCNMSMW